MQLVSLYPFDPTGRASANRIENQSITVTPPTQITDYSYVVPRGAPFYADSLVVKDGRNVGARTLVENVDYWCVIDFLSASVSLTKRVCVGIALLDPGYSGTLYITYQAVGGNYSLADYSVLEELIRERYVVKHVSYEQIINLPEGFAPEWHRHEIADMVGMGQVVTTLNNIKIAIDGRQGSYGQLSAQISNHTGSSVAHTPSQVGLSNVKNYDVATLAEANTGAANKYVTAAVMKQYVSGQRQDVSGLITTSAANATFATKAQLNNYSTTSQSDSKYALKSDSYTKAQVNALIEGIDVSSSLSGFYTKSQSDAKYALKTDISGYIKESVADGRYATKASMTSYSTTSQSDGKYAIKSASYTKSESDSRYLLPSALNGYLTQSTADNRYLQTSALNSYVKNNEAYGAVLNNITQDWSKLKTPKLTFTSKNESGMSYATSLDLNLDRFAMTNEVRLLADYWKDYNIMISNTQGVHYRTFTSKISYRSYNLTVVWKIIRMGQTVHLTWSCEDAFYLNEDVIVLYTTASSGQQHANAGVAVGSANTAGAILGQTTNISTLTLTSYHNEILHNNLYADYWTRSAGRPRINRANGTVVIPIFTNGIGGDRTTTYTYGFFGGMTFIVDNQTLYDVMVGWFNKGALVTFKPSQFSD